MVHFLKQNQHIFPIPLAKSIFMKFQYPSSVPPCLSKRLERIVYNRLYSFFLESDSLYDKQFGFQNKIQLNKKLFILQTRLESFRCAFKIFTQRLFPLKDKKWREQV